MASVSPPTHTAWRSSNIGTLLLVASTRVIAIKLAVIRAHGFAVTEAQLALFHAIDDGGSRLTALAVGARLSKAAMADLVDRAEVAGWTFRTVDPADSRAKLIQLTAGGRRLRAALGDGVAAAERDTAAELGATAAALLKKRLGDYVAAGPEAALAIKTAPSATARNTAPATATSAATNIGRALALASQRFVADVATRTAAEGFEASPALLGVMRHLDLDGTRLTEIAARARSTKQSVRELVTRAERLGYVVRGADADDGRARNITFTARGRDLLDAVRRSVFAAEASMAAIIGVAAFDAAKRDLGRLSAEPLAVAA